MGIEGMPPPPGGAQNKKPQKEKGRLGKFLRMALLGSSIAGGSGVATNDTMNYLAQRKIDQMTAAAQANQQALEEADTLKTMIDDTIRAANMEQILVDVPESKNIEDRRFETEQDTLARMGDAAAKASETLSRKYTKNK